MEFCILPLIMEGVFLSNTVASPNVFLHIKIGLSVRLYDEG